MLARGRAIRCDDAANIDEARNRALGLAVEHLVAEYVDLRFIVLVGSWALGRPSIASDLDLAAIVDCPPVLNEASLSLQCEKHLFDVQFIESRWVEDCCRRSVFDLRELREVGRIATGRVIWGSRSVHNRFVKSSAHATLAPLDLILLSTYGSPSGAISSETVEQRLWRLLSIGLALAILAVALLPVRYQKPKWLLQDLTQGFPELARLLTRTLRGNSAVVSSTVAESMLDAVEKICSQLGYDGMRRVEQSPLIYRRVRDSWKDARALIVAGLFDSACVVAAMALLDTRTLLQESREGRVDLLQAPSSWWTTAMSAMLDVSGMTSSELGDVSNELESARVRVEREHWLRLENLAGSLKRVHSSDTSRLMRSALLNVNQVSPTIWFGGQVKNQTGLALLQAAGITTIVLVAAECQDCASIPADMFHVERIPLLDTELTQERADQLERAVGDLHGRCSGRAGAILVCCNYGINRSALVAALLLSASTGIARSHAADFIRRCKRDALSNLSFRRYLQNG